MNFVPWRQNAARLMRVAPLVIGLAPFLTTAAISAQETAPGAGTACQSVIEHDVAAQTQRLLADCVTDETIIVANGWAFDGGGHTIYAVDPAAGRLQAAVVLIGEGAGDIHDVAVDGTGLEAPCLVDGGATPLNGIVFMNSTGEARHVTVRGIARIVPADQASSADGESQRKSCGTGVAIVGESVATVAASTISDVGYVGILVEGGTATLASNVIVRTEDTGILAMRGAHLEVMPGNQVRYGNAGIQFEGAGTEGTIADSGVGRMKTAGIVAMAGARVALAGAAVADVDGLGVVAAGGGVITAERVDVQRTGRALVADGGSLQIQEGTIATCALGVLSMNGGSANLSDSTVQACDVGAAEGSPGSRLAITASTITGSNRAGVMLEGAAEADLRELRIMQSGVGIAATDHNLVEIVDAHIQDTTQAGMSVAGGSQVTLTSSAMRNPGEFGVIVADAGTLLVSREASITGAGQTGIQVLAGGWLETSDSRLYGGETGIAVGGAGSTARIAETSLSATGTNLLVTDRAQVDVTRLNAAGGATGVVVSADGVRVLAGGWVSVESSTITNAAGSAISLQRGADLPTAVEIVLDETGCTPRVVNFPAGVRTEITFRNAGQTRAQINTSSGLLFDLAPSASEVMWLTSVPVDTTLQCVLPGGNGAWEEVLLRAVAPDQIPASAQPVEPQVVQANNISGGGQGITVEAGVRAVITENTIEGVSGEALAFAEDAIVESRNNRIVAGTPSPDDVE